MHIRIHISAPAVSALHLITEQYKILSPAELRHSLYEILIEGLYSAFTLYAFHHYAGDLVIPYGFLHRIEVHRHGNESRRKRLIKLMEYILAGCRKSGKGPAVEAVFQSYYRIVFLSLMLRGVFSYGLYAVFICLGSGVGVEHLFHAGLFAQKFRKPYAGLRIIKIGGMLQRSKLLCHSLLPFCIGYSKGCDAYA